MNTNKKALLAVILGNSIFGFSFLFSKLALEIAEPNVLVAIRFFVAFLVLNIIVVIGTHIKKQDGTSLINFSLKNKPLKHVLLLAFFQPVLYFFAETQGILYTSSTFAGIIIAVIPIAGICADLLIMHSSVSKKQIFCALFSIVGVIITTIGATDMRSSTKGLLFLLLAVLSGSLFYVFSKKSGAYYNALEQTYVMFCVGFIVYMTAALIQCRGQYQVLIFDVISQPMFIVSILYLGVISSVAAFLLLNYGSKFVSVSNATLFANLTTVISIFAGVLILHENFTLPQLIGAVIILISVYVAR